jgi:membrane protein
VSHGHGALIRDAARTFSTRGARFLSAGVAFYSLLGAAPLFVVVLRILGAVFGRARAESAVWSALAQWLAPEGLAGVRALTESLDAAQGSAGTIGGALVVYASTRLFRALHHALNHLWNVDVDAATRDRPRLQRYAAHYGTALLLTLFVATLMTVFLGLKSAFAVLAAVGRDEAPAVLFLLDAAASVVLAFALFLVLYRFLPETHPPLRDAARCALLSTALFAPGSALVTAYLHHKSLLLLYGGAGAVVVALLWVYYSAQVFFFGACVGAALRDKERDQDARARADRSG